MTIVTTLSAARERKQAELLNRANRFDRLADARRMLLRLSHLILERGTSRRELAELLAELAADLSP
jgi:hypothetical protein